MPESPVNPYKSPSAGDDARSRRPSPPSSTGFWVWTALNALFLAGLLATQPVFAARLEALGAGLPPVTTLVLGPVFPWIHGGLLVAIIAARRALNAERYSNFWEGALLVLVGVVVSYYVIAIWLAYPFPCPPLT